MYASLLRLGPLGLMLLALSCAPSVRLTAPSAPADAVVARFLVDIEGLESEFPDQAEGALPVTIEAVRAARHARTALETLRNPDNTPVKTALDSIYAAVETHLADALGLRLLPVDTLRGAVPYVLGYPMGSAREVAQNGRFAHALAVTIDVTVPDQETGFYSILGTGKAITKGHPEMYLTVQLIDRTGQEQWHDRVRVRSKEAVELSERWLLGIRTRSQVSDAATLPVLTRQALTKLLARSGRSTPRTTG